MLNVIATELIHELNNGHRWDPRQDRTTACFNYLPGTKYTPPNDYMLPQWSGINMK